MTDARIRGEWLGLLRFDNLTDTAWRVFTGGLMWSAEQGTDGFIPTRYLKFLHPDGEQPVAIQQITQAGIWEVTADGAQFIDWDGALGQSTALQVETQKANARERQRAYRERERQKLAKSIGFTDTTAAALDALPSTRDVTRDVTGPVTGHVGKGTGEGSGKDSKPASTAKSEAEEVLEWPVAKIPNSNQCRICGQAVSGELDAWGLCSKVSVPHTEARKEPAA